MFDITIPVDDKRRLLLTGQSFTLGMALKVNR